MFFQLSTSFHYSTAKQFHYGLKNKNSRSENQLLWLIEDAPSLRSNIPQTALVATLDTYDLFRFPIAAVSF
jgi:hypothetical protein